MSKKEQNLEGIKIECSVCGLEKALTTGFYVSSNEEYSDTGYCDVCKNCMRNMIVNEKSGFVEEDRFRIYACRHLNLPFVKTVYDDVIRNPRVNSKNIISEYRKKIKFNPSYKDLTYKDTDYISQNRDGIVAKDISGNVVQVTDEMIAFWGPGHKAEYYIDAQSKYDRFMEYVNEDELDYKTQSDFKKLCQLEIKFNEMTLNPDVRPNDMKAMTDAISKLSEDLNIKALQKKQDQNDNRKYRIGVLAKFIEDVRMEPIPKLKETDWLGDMPKSEFDIDMAFFKSEILDELGRENPYKDIVNQEKSKYTPQIDYDAYDDDTEATPYEESDNR